jgi:iron complex outermembrane receptor protein
MSSSCAACRAGHADRFIFPPASLKRLTARSLASLLALVVLAGPMAARGQPVAPPAAAASAPTETQRVEVSGGRPSDTEERRRSTAAKIVVGRDEIERFGDASLGDVLKRLPGVTIGGTPGRGGAIRMRGLGGGYTQILLDGERVQGGLSLDTIDPDMVERIEIQRAPTAETGGRAIAGTINIITREGFRKRLNDLKLSAGLQNGILWPSASWTRDDTWGALSYSLTLNTWAWRRDDEGETTTTAPERRLVEATESSSRRHGVNANARLQWPLDDGETLMLMPLLVASQGSGHSRTVADFSGTPAPGLQPYDLALGESDSRFLLTRLNGQWRQRLGEGRIEWRGGVAASQSSSRSLRREFDSATALPALDESTDSRERNAHLNARYSVLLGESNQFVAGAELDAARREEDSRSTLRDPLGGPPSFDQRDDLRAATQRLAAYAQDEWNLTPQWAAHAGLRWEGLTTEGEGEVNLPAARNHSSVWTPVLHGVWKPEPKSRDQLRISLTRSYRSPTLQNLLGRYDVSSRFPTGDNTPTSPDRAGNPALRPELATGIDVALERYLPGGGLLSANVFHRRVTDLMRTLTTLETVPGFATPRWVARPRNIGAATTQGLELEARLRLNEWIDDAPAVDLRTNLSLLRSMVDDVPGPDNRLDQQPGGTLNVGADYRWPGTPLTMGGNLNLTPGYTTRLSDTQWAVQSAKRVVDAYLLWTVNPGLRLRLTASNLLHEASESASVVADERADTVAASFVNWRLQLELKL